MKKNRPESVRAVHVPRRLEIGTRRASAPGTTLSCLVLASTTDEWVGVDLASGALVRSPAPASETVAFGSWASFSVISFPLASETMLIDPSRPEAVQPAETPVATGRVRRRTARHFLQRLAAPEHDGAPILGSRGPSLAFVDLDGNSPSVVLIATDAKHLELLTRNDGTSACAITWGGTSQVLPVLDERGRQVAEQSAPRSLSGAALGAALGFRPGYLLCGLGAIQSGHAPKVVFSILPAVP